MRPAPKKLRLKKLGLVTVSTLLALLAAEAATRVSAARSNRKLLSQSDVPERPKPDPGQHVFLGDIIQLSTNDRIVYELLPDLDGVFFRNRVVTTNAYGFRGPAIEEAKENTRTIVGIGDSVMFGHGVADNLYYLAHLQRRFQKAFPTFHWRCINTGVPGYNTVQEVETLVTKALLFEPDIVLLGLVPNDLAVPTYLMAEVDPYDFTQSFLLNLVRERLSKGRRRHGGGGPQGARPAPRPPPGYGRRVAWACPVRPTPCWRVCLTATGRWSAGRPTPERSHG